MNLRKVILWFILCFLIGFVVSFLIQEGIIRHVRNGFLAVPLYMYPLLLIAMFYVTLAVHELAHLIVFKVQGVKIKALYLTMFVFYKDEHKWKLAVRPKLWVLFGGMVVPDLDDIDDDDKYQKLIKSFSNSLIAAPRVTIIFAGLSIIFMLMTIILRSNPSLTGYLMVMTIYIVCFSFIYIWASRLNTDQFYGDFVAHKKMNEDQTFQIIQINQYAQFSSHFTEKGETFLFEKAKTMIKNQPISYKLFDLMLIHIYVSFVTANPTENDYIVTKKIEMLSTVGLTRTAHGIEIGYDIAAMFYAIDDPHKAYQMFDMLYKKKPKDMDLLQAEYLIRRFEHITHIAYHDMYLNDRNLIYIGQNWIFDPLMDPYQEQINGHEKLPFKIHETKVDLKPELEADKVDLDKEKSD